MAARPRIADADFVLLINANGSPVSFVVPERFGSPGVEWEVVVDTAAPMSGAGAAGAGRLAGTVGVAGSALSVPVDERSIVVLRGRRLNGDPVR